MQRYFFRISYDGSGFSGWQIQPDAFSVQEAIERSLGILFSHNKQAIVGCGRTDAGVHASCYYFHTDLPDTRFTEKDLLFKLNGMLPKEIAVLEVFKVDHPLHARFDACLRTYRYFIHQKKDPFKSAYSYYYKGELAIESMQEAATYLLGEKDFTSFSKVHTDVKTNRCTVSKVRWFQPESNTICFEISANRFLRNMVRAVVGTLLEVGRGKLEISDVHQILIKKDRGEAGASAPAHGLFLYDVIYPFHHKSE